MVDYEQTLRLIKLAQKGDEEAKDMLIKQNYPLVKSVIRRYRNKGVDYDDLFQLGFVRQRLECLKNKFISSNYKELVIK